MLKIFDFKCKDCGEIHELCLKHEAQAECLSCGSKNVEKLFSAPNVIIAPEHQAAPKEV